MKIMGHGLPRVGITMGDAAGIGPEIVVKALLDENILRLCDCTVIGDAVHMRSIAVRLGIDQDRIFSKVTVINLGNLPDEIDFGIDSAITGKAAAENILQAVKMWRAGEIDAIATAPISKKAIAMGGYDFPGHTEFLAKLTDTSEFAMSFFADKLRVVLLSTHLSLRDAIAMVKKDRLVKLIEFSSRQLGSLLKSSVHIAVAGLNPHASEGGMFGREEIDEIIPAIEHCREHGIRVSGPYSPDTIFHRANNGEFGAVIALYHDQATIPVKSLAFNSAVNVTLGLPLIRTSVDHGTAYDIAGKGVAESSSMKAAIRLGAELASLS